MKSFTAYINEHEGEGFVSEAQVASTFIHHRDWQQGHAQELVVERAEAKAKKEIDDEAKRVKKAEEKAKKDAEKADKEAKKEADRKAKEEEKAAKEAAASGADGDDSDSTNDGEKRTRRRLNTREEPVTAGVSEQSF
jgi:hypothetical protein